MKKELKSAFGSMVKGFAYVFLEVVMLVILWKFIDASIIQKTIFSTLIIVLLLVPLLNFLNFFKLLIFGIMGCLKKPKELLKDEISS